MAKKRNYKKEYEKFQKSEKAKKDRALRNNARRKAEKEGKVKKGDGKDVHHVGGHLTGRVIIIPASENRGKNEKSRKKGSKRKK